MKIIAANWKMNKTNAEAREFFAEYETLVSQTENRVIFCAPYTTLPTVIMKSRELGFGVGAQNLHAAKNGTFTGEISADMLVDIGAQSVIVGHSERRAQFGERDDVINRKIKAALVAGLEVIFCIGEKIEERNNGNAFDVLHMQFIQGLKDIRDPRNLIVAYEPVWAISGGDPSKPKPIATTEQIAEVHAFIKKLIAQQFGTTDIPVLYGGSANDTNVDEIFAIPNVDGALVGGASLVAEKFAKMVNYSE